jgi:hypothetical protein
MILLGIMKYNPLKKEIVLNRKLNKLDEFVLDFISCLDNYVIVSGYVSILLGRSRATEDVDLLIPGISFSDFEELWKKLSEENFECLNTHNLNEAYGMLSEFAIRFSKKRKPTPNIEFKIIKTDLDKYSYENKTKVILRDKILFISPIEMQIAYKLFLAADGTDEELLSDKDIEDARYLYRLFLEKINKEELLTLINKLNVGKKFELLSENESK